MHVYDVNENSFFIISFDSSYNSFCSYGEVFDLQKHPQVGIIVYFTCVSYLCVTKFPLVQCPVVRVH